MGNIPPKPNPRETDAVTMNDDDEPIVLKMVTKEFAEWHEARAERAIEALKLAEDKARGGLCSFSLGAKHAFLNDIKVEAKKALAELTDTGERGC